VDSAMSVSVVVDTKRLKSLAKAMPLAKQQALEDTAGKINRDAKKMAPVVTGRLRSSIHVERPGEKSYQYVWGGKGDKPGGSANGKLDSVIVKDDQRLVGTNVEYAAAKEFGWYGVQNVKTHVRRMTQAFGKQISPQDVIIGAHQRATHTNAKPYLLPAYHKNRKLLKKRMEIRTQQAIRKATK
jgi:phage gpG-like protein